MKLYSGRIPYHPIRGELQHYPEDTYSWDGQVRTVQEPDWRENTPFEQEMAVVDYARGRSAAYFILEDESGKRHPVFMKEFIQIVPHMVKGKLRGTWAACKRGSNYGLVFIAPSTDSATSRNKPLE